MEKNSAGECVHEGTEPMRVRLLSYWLFLPQKMVSLPTWELDWPLSMRGQAESFALETPRERAASGEPLLHQ